MGLLEKLNKSSFFRDLVYYPLVSGLISLSGCTGGSGPSDPYNPPGGGNGNGGYVEDSGRTNNNGEIGLDVDGQKFDIEVKNETGSALYNIDVKGINFTYGGHNVYGFLAKDANGNYFPDVVYIDLNDISSISGEDAFSINHFLSEVRGRDYKKETHDGNEPYIYSFSTNPRLRYLDTVTLDDLHDFYSENDAITRNIDMLEFVAEVSNRPELSFALEAAKFRQTFIDNLSNYNDIVNSVASFFGASFEKEAYYIDVYSNNLGVLVHESSQKDFSTIKGTVWGQNGNEINGSFIQTIEGPVSVSTLTDINGIYFLKYLTGGDYTIRASSSGYQSREKSKWIIRSDYHYPECKELNFVLNLNHEVELDTLVLQPGYVDGKDTYLRRAYAFGNHIYDGSGPNDDELWCGFDKDGDFTAMNRIFLEFTQLPRNLNVESAKFSFFGWPVENEIVSLKIYSCSASWNENMNWNSQPPLNTNFYKNVTVYRNPGVMTEVNITDIVSEWSNNLNNGLVMKLDIEEGYGSDYQIKVHSSDNLDTSLRPKLEVIYER